MMAADFREMLKQMREAPFVDRSDEPDLNDTMTPLPERLRGAVDAAGADGSKAVAWFTLNEGIVYRFFTHGKASPEVWQRLRESLPALGYWPVILGPNESIVGHDSIREGASLSSVGAVLSAAKEVDLNGWLRDRYASMHECDAERSANLEGSWPEDDPSDEVEADCVLSTPLDPVTRRAYKQVWMGLLPVRNSWESAAALAFGDWNEVPRPEIHVALHRRWQAEYGAEVACMKNDVIEMAVSRPPNSRDAALELARLHYLYCPDIVEQGTETIQALASNLFEDRYWYFWWD